MYSRASHIYHQIRIDLDTQYMCLSSRYGKTEHLYLTPNYPDWSFKKVTLTRTTYEGPTHMSALLHISTINKKRNFAYHREGRSNRLYTTHSIAMWFYCDWFYEANAIGLWICRVIMRSLVDTLSYLHNYVVVCGSVFPYFSQYPLDI